MGLSAFEELETASCTHFFARHMRVSGAAYRVDAHYPADTDCTRPDRQRNELKGMRTPGGGYVSMEQGQHWLLTYAMYIPSSLKATTRFTHIHQELGVIGVRTTQGPLLTISLHDHEGVPSIELQLNQEHWSPVPLAPIQDRWVNVELEVKWDDAGLVRWTIRDSAASYVDASRPWDGWRPGTERVRPKWGIYRSRESPQLQSTYLLLADMAAYRR
jgi:chitin-binding protein